MKTPGKYKCRMVRRYFSTRMASFVQRRPPHGCTMFGTDWIITRRNSWRATKKKRKAAFYPKNPFLNFFFLLFSHNWFLLHSFFLLRISERRKQNPWYTIYNANSLSRPAVSDSTRLLSSSFLTHTHIRASLFLPFNVSLFIRVSFILSKLLGGSLFTKYFNETNWGNNVAAASVTMVKKWWKSGNHWAE